MLPNMTPEELERWHYANGDTERAAVFAVIADHEDEIRQLDLAMEKVRETANSV